MSEFEQSIAGILASEDNKLDRKYWGTCAYLPTYTVKKAIDRQISDKSENSVHITSERKDNKVFLDIEVIRVIWPSLGGYNVSAMTTEATELVSILQRRFGLKRKVLQNRGK